MEGLQVKWTRSGRSFAFQVEPRCLLSDTESAEYERLATWFLAWQPPASSYALGPHITVHDTVRSHAHRCARIRAGLRGQEQRAMLAWMRAHGQIFGAKD